MNNNFDYLHSEIVSTNENFEELSESVGVSIGGINSKIDSQLSVFQSQMNNVFDEANKNSDEALNKALSALEYFFPDYTLFEKKDNGVLYQAPCNGWLLVIKSNSNKSKHADLYIGNTSDNLIKVLDNGSNVVCQCGAMYLIKKGWWYKSTKVDNYYSFMNYGFIPLDKTTQGDS